MRHWGWLLVGALLLSSERRAQSDIKGIGAKVEFQSYNIAQMYDLARDLRGSWKPLRIWGYFQRAPNADAAVPGPAMVLSPGSGGVGPELAQWVQAFNEIGVSTFVVDTLAPRGIRSVVSDQSLLNPAANLIDAFLALEELSKRPDIDRQRIGIMGFSRGGEVAFRSAIEPLRNAALHSDLKFALHIPVYAGCNQVYWAPAVTGAPILNLLGEFDDYTTAEPCRTLAKRYEDAGANVKTITYRAAYHGWDLLERETVNSSITTASSCGVVRWDIGPWRITSERTGKTMSAGELPSFFNSCSKRGAHVGRNEAAFRQSRADAQEFVRAYLLAKPAGN